MFDIQIIAKYPFLSAAKEYVSGLKFSLDEILSHPIYCASLDLGKQRFLSALNGSISPNLDDQLSMELTVLSYPIAKILANLTGNKTLVQRYAQGEANSAYSLLKEDEKKLVDFVKNDIGFSATDGQMRVLDYLRLSSQIARFDPRWHLVNREVNAGMLSISESEALILVREQIKETVASPPSKIIAPKVLKQEASKLKNLTFTSPRDIRISQLDENALSACIKELLGLLESGSLNHNGMFILATFFTGLGLAKEDILKILERSPKYTESIAGYQLDFLMGEAGGTKYTCPSCSKIKSYGFCKTTCNVKHPLQYYRAHSTAG